MYIEKSKDYSSSKKVTLLPKEEQLVWLMEEYGDMVIRLAYTYVKQLQLLIRAEKQAHQPVCLFF